jgi:hypothetical protein
MVNQISDEGYLSRAIIGSRGTSANIARAAKNVYAFARNREEQT